MDAEEVIAVGKFITFGFPHGKKCTIKSLKNGQSKWERMPMMTSAKKHKILKNSKDKQSDFNLSRIESYSAADSIDFEKFHGKCLDFCDDTDKNDLENAANIYKTKMLTKVDRNPNRYALIYVYSVGTLENINMFSENSRYKMEQTYPGTTICICDRNFTHCELMVSTLSPCTSDHIMHSLYCEKRKINENVKVFVRLIRVPDELSYISPTEHGTCAARILLCKGALVF